MKVFNFKKQETETFSQMNSGIKNKEENSGGSVLEYHSLITKKMTQRPKS